MLLSLRIGSYSPAFVGVVLLTFRAACGHTVGPTGWASDATASADSALSDASTSNDSNDGLAALDSGSPDADVVVHTGTTYLYVIDQASVAPSDPAFAWGFNLDGLFSSATDGNGCDVADQFAVYDIDQNCPTTGPDGGCAVSPNPGCVGGVDAGACVGGTDNQLPNFAGVFSAITGTDLQTTLTNAIDSSRTVILLRVTDINDPQNDPDVRAYLYNGYPTFSAPCSMVQPGGVYQVTRGSLVGGGTTLDDAAFQVHGRIDSGRLSIQTPPTLTFPFAIPGAPLTLRLFGLQIRMDMSPQNASRGVLGGWFHAADVVTAATFLTMNRASAEQLAASFVDIQWMGVCSDLTATPPRLGGISTGLGFHAVSAQVSATSVVADGPMPGVCGTM